MIKMFRLLLISLLLVSIVNSSRAGIGFAVTGDVTVTTPFATVPTLSSLDLSSGTLSPVFVASTTSYTASVANATSAITVRPTLTTTTATVRVNGALVNSGGDSQSVPLSVGNNTIAILGTAEDGITTTTYTLTVTRVPSTDSTLSALTLSSGTLSPVFASSTTSYTASVENATSAITVRPTLTTTTATVRVNGALVTSGGDSQIIPLTVGNNTITVVGTAQDGTTISTYTMTVTRAPSNVSTLSALTLSSGTLSPVFASSTTSYTASVENATSAITVQPTLTTTTATVRVRVNGALVTSGGDSQNIPLTVGNNTITVVGTAQDGTTTSTYTMTVTRAPSNVSTLSALTLSSGTLSPVFASSTTSYTASVENATSTITVTPVVTNSFATVRVNGTLVTSGSASQSIPLTIGTNTIAVVWTAQDGTTTSNYTITVTRLSLVASFTSPSSIPVTAASYTATGNDVQLSLGFAPPTGTNLTVVKNTGLPFISGQFSNLAHGQVVNLSYGGKSYRFVANYYGGSGNDFVLEWPYRDLATWGGRTKSSVPVQVTQSGVLAGKTVVTVSGGWQFSLALCSDGTIVQWSDDSIVPVEVIQSMVLSGKTVVAVSAGLRHSLALCSDGTIVAWGDGSYGQLGGSVQFSYAPALVTQSGVLSGKKVVAVSAGSLHSLALCTDGTIAAWGYNVSGQLGNNSTTKSWVPVLVSQSGVLSGKSVLAISAGQSHSLALCTDGTIAAWGYNNNGQLGNGSTITSSVPVLVTQSGVLSGKTVVAVSAGDSHSLALCSDGTIAAWGQNFSGRLGNNSTTDSSVPVLVNQSGVLSGKSVVAISADETHSLALCSDGTTAAWGNNYYGQLGNGSTITSSVPVLVTQSGVLSGKTVVAVSAGAYHSLALASYENTPDLSNLSLSAGGIQPQFDPDTTVYNVDVLFAVSSITVTPTARFTTNVIRLNDSVVTSGSSSQSISLAVGVNSITVQVTAPDGITTKTYTINVTRQPASSIANLSSLVPSIGTLSPTFTSSSTSYSSSVANTTNSITLRPTVTDTAATIKVNGIPVASGSKSLEIPLSGGDNTILVLVTAQDGITNKLYTISFTRPRLALEASFISSSGIPLIVESFTAAGNDVQLSLGFAPPTGTNLTVVKNTGLPFIGGQFSNLAHGQVVDLSYAGKSYRFVVNYYGGSGNDLVLEWPYRDLAAWGNNDDGQLGNNSTTASSVPVLVNQSGVLAGKTVVAVSANYQTSLALCSDGTIVEWGYNSAPVGVTQSGVLSGKTVVAVSAGNGHRLALCSDGTIAAWGFNRGGQLGNNRTEFYSSDPVLVDQTGVLAGKFVVAVSAGSSHSLALCTDGTIVAWGQNFNGRLGNNSTTDSSVPVLVTQSGVLSGKTVVAISAHESSLALCTDGTIAAWGSNSVGQLGNNSTTNSSVPVLVTQSGVLSGKTVVAVSAGGGHNLALCTDGTIAAWGYNQRGRLGNNSYSDSRVPVLVTQSGVLSGKTVVAVSASEYFSLALCSDGTIAAWGVNSGLGNNSYRDSNVPVLVDQSGVLAGKTAVAFSAGSLHGLGVASYENTPDLSNLSLSAGGIQPQFDPDTTVYNVDVLFAVSSITVTPTAAVTTNVILLNNSVVTSGNSSKLISLAVGVNSIKVQVTAPDGITTKTYTINVTRQPASSTATLLGLLPSSGVLSPTFTSSSTSYSSSVPNATTAITLRPTAADTTASIKVNESAVNSGNNSQSIPLSVGPNTMTVLVVAEDGITNKTYTLTVTRAPSAVSTLSALTLSSGTLSPGFASGTRNYTASVTNATTSITVRPTVTDATAEIKVNGVSVSSGSNSQPIALAVGTNPITVLVTAQDGVTTSTYTLAVSRAPSSISTLSNLLPSSGSLSPVFSSATPTYTVTVNSSTLSVTPTLSDSTATLKVNGTMVSSGMASAAIPLAIGSNTIIAVVTAQDGVSKSTYTLTVIRLSTVSTLSGLAVDSGPLSPAFSSGTLAYSARVDNTTTSVKVTPTSTEPYAAVTVNGSTVVSGNASGSIPLLAGPNTIQVVGTAQDGTSTTYTLTITRAFLDVVFTSATTGTIQASNYHATGNAVNLALTFAPPTGTNLTLVNQTGLGFIIGRYANLAQGQTITLSHNEVIYRFVVNYYGGTGNDLVLHWADNEVSAWGANNRGQLGDGTSNNSSLPRVVTNTGALSGKTILAISAGSSHSLALCSDGTVAAWGYNFHGQLGNGSTTDTSVPVRVDQSGVLAGKTVVSVAAGHSHSLALCSDGTLASWGWNAHGQLGNDSTTSSSIPVSVIRTGELNGKVVTSMVTGYHHNLAYSADGTLVSWGRNNAGQLGTNNVTNSQIPVNITSSGALSGRRVITLAAGGEHSLVLCQDGALVSWGKNANGQLGIGSTADSLLPVEVDATDVLAGRSVLTISAGGFHNLAACTDGTLVAFGRNSNGQLGNNSTADATMPVAVNLSPALNGKTVTGLLGTNAHSLALCSDGSLASWGSGSNGLLGNGGTANSNVPVGVVTSSYGSAKGFVALPSGSSASHSLALAALPLSSDSGLVSLSLSSGTLNPVFSSAITAYAVSDPGEVPFIQITPVKANVYASIQVNEIAVESGAASARIPLAVGENAITITVTAQNGTQTTTTVRVSRTGGYASWSGSAFTLAELTDPAISGDNASPASDGISNLMKYALALNPKLSGNAALPSGSVQGGYLTLTYRKNKLADDLIYTVEAGHSLTADIWLPATTVLSQTDEGSHWLVTIRDSVPQAGQPIRFMRLKVER